MDPRRFHSRLFDAVREVIPPGAGIVCAVSGGPDSMAMLHGLVKVNEIQRCGWRLIVAHLDHCLREESSEDAEFVRGEAAALGLEFEFRRADVAATALTNRESIEEAGRRLRYEFLEKTTSEADAGFVAVGHHADDQAETVLHRIARGTGLRGLAGMAATRPIRPDSTIQVVRPLLSIRSDELATYLAHRGLASRQDPTNDENSGPTRNRIRNKVLPLLESEVNPEVVAALVRLAEQARRVNDALRSLAEQAFAELKKDQGAGCIVVSADELRRLPRGLISEVIVLVLERLGAERQEIGFERLEAIATLLDDNPGMRRIELPGGAYVERRGARLRFQVGTQEPDGVRASVRVIQEDRR